MGVDLVQQYDTEAESSSFDDLPAGTYEAQIVENDRVPFSKKEDKGDCLTLCWQVTSGPYEKRLFWQRLALWFQGSEKTPGQTVQIANQQFAAVRKATGQNIVNNADELMFIPCSVTYGPQKNNPEYSEVKKVMPLGGNVRQIGSAAPVQGNAQQARASTHAPANQGTRAPWPRPAA
ncbi:MAG TPA: hypothetical protein VIL30_14450 [Ramlibacter sp.]|jgi:hypothetical protein